MRKTYFEETAVKVSRVSIVGNTALTLFKLLAGILAHSEAMVSDAIHSASDVLSSFIVIIGVRLSAKEADREHPYGHERMESVAAIVLAVILCITGLFIGHTAIEKLTNGTITEQPGILALAAAFISIIAKEIMFRYTKFHAKAINSDALMAEAWHHRSDALSSVGALVGIAGARMGYTWLDPVASLIICAFIIKAAYDIFSDAVEKMVDHACSEETEKEIMAFALRQKGVMGVDRLSTREFGSKLYVDIEINADGNLTLKESHDIAEKLHEAIETEFPNVKHIMVHVNPHI